MRALLTSARRVVIALVLIALVVGGVFYAIREGSASRQDRAYATALAAAQASTRVVLDARAETLGMSQETWLCEKRAGMPVSEALIHIMSDSFGMGAGWSEELAKSYSDIAPPKRWRSFHQLAVLRQVELGTLSRSVGAANQRAIVVAARARPWTDLGIAEALARDPVFRMHDAAADRARDGVAEYSMLMRRSLPDSYETSKMIREEMVTFKRTGVFDFAGVYENATMPRDQKPVQGSSASMVAAGATTAGTNGIADGSSGYRMPPRQTTSADAMAVCATGKYDPEYTQGQGDGHLDPVAGLPVAAPASTTLVPAPTPAPATP